MSTFDSWLSERGPIMASAINYHSETICEHVSARMVASFPNLCFDPLRHDAQAFQKLTFEETPRRFHRLLQVVLLCHSPGIVEREYRWGWRLLSRYNVERRHLLAHARWYFEETFATVPLAAEDKLQLIELRDMVIGMIESITAAPASMSDHAQRRQRHNGTNGASAGHHR